MMDRLKYICKEEGIKFTSEVRMSSSRNGIHLFFYSHNLILKLGEALAEVSEGDLRKAITYLQSAHSLYGKDTTGDSIISISGVRKKKASFCSDTLKKKENSYLCHQGAGQGSDVKLL
jgi:DNA polymerase III delta prime subunit